MDTEKILREIGSRVYEQRRQLNLTQEQLAEKMNVSIQMISYLETGKKAIRPENLIRLCQVLQVSADYILTGQASPMDADRIARKMNTLSPRNFQLVEAIIDNCIALAEKKQEVS